MRSGILIGTCAWLLGAAAATTGSLYAVNDLGQGLIAQHSKQVTVAMVNAELALEHSARTSPSPSTSPPATSPSPSPSSPAAQQSRSATPSPPPDPGELLISRDGTVVAVCKSAGAYLVSWSPEQGFQADHVIRGPARVAKVAFLGSSGGVVMDVTCHAGQPADRVRRVTWNYRPGQRH